jgi:DNA modification methylase
MINKIHCGDCLDILKRIPDEYLQCVVTSPPYWGLRDYGTNGQLGLEKTPEEYVEKMVAVFREVRRVLKKDGSVFLNLGDSYAGSLKGEGGTYELSKKQNSNRGSHYGKDTGEKHKFNHNLKPKDLVGIPWRVAFALQSDGWWLRQDIIWAKPNPMPESVTDRCTKAHEYIFLLTKSTKYYFDADAIREPHKGNWFNDNRGKNKDVKESIMEYEHGGNKSFGETMNPLGANKRSVWTVSTKPYKEAHFATFPEELIIPCVLAGSKEGDIILDPFMGAGTTALVALRTRRNYIGSELNPEYVKMAEKRISTLKNQVAIL